MLSVQAEEFLYNQALEEIVREIAENIRADCLESALPISRDALVKKYGTWTKDVKTRYLDWTGFQIGEEGVDYAISYGCNGPEPDLKLVTINGNLYVAVADYDEAAFKK